MRISDWSSDVCSSDLRYARIGTTRNQGIEMSVSGALTKRLNMVAGGVFLKPRVIEDATAAAAIGKRPVGLPDHFINLNLNWRTPIAKDRKSTRLNSSH